MRIDTHAVNIALTEALKRFAESRVWMAARRHVSRVAWMGLWLVDHKLGPDRPGLSCRIDVWLRGIGHLTVRHADTDIHVAIDIAAARLEQSITRALREAAERGIAPARTTRDSVYPRHPRRKQPHSMPRLAVAIERRDARRRLPVLPWLRIKYGIEQVSRITLPSQVWEDIADGADRGELLRGRLLVSLLHWPELIVVLGRSNGIDDEAVRDEQQRVRQIVQRIRDWSVPVEVAGVWINEQWGPDGHVESQELDCVPVEAEPEAVAAPAETSDYHPDVSRDNGRLAAREEVTSP